MPTYLESWNESSPSGSSVRSLGDDSIRAFKRAIRERFGTDHDAQADESSVQTIGYHKQCTFIETASLPSGDTGLPVLGAETNSENDKPELCWKDEANNKCFLTKDGKIDPKYFGDLSRVSDTSGNLPLANLGNVIGNVPVGGIIMYSGLIANVPSGWAFCNGSNGTPDLRDRMVICGKQDDAGAVKTNVTGVLTVSGGSSTKTLSVTEIPAHTHSFTLRNSNGWDGSSLLVQGSTAANQNNTMVTNSTGGGSSFSLLNPYYALAFIMRIS